MSASKQFRRPVEFLSTTNIVGTTGGSVYIAGGLNVDSFNTNSSTIANLVITNNLLTSSGNNLISSQWTSFSQHIAFTTGNVGINTTAPGFSLDVNGGARIIGGLTSGTLTTVIGASIPSLLSSTILASTSVSSGAIYSTNITSTNIVGTTATIPNITFTNVTSTNIVGTTSTIPNSIFTNITTSTLLATTQVSSGALYSTNITSTNIVGTTATIPNITFTNVTSTNIVGTTSTIPNSIFTNITTSTLLATTRVSSGALYSTNITSTNIVGTTATIPNIIHTNVTSAALTLTTGLSTGNIRLNDNSIYLRTNNDTSNGLQWNTLGDGPRLWGNFGGTLAYGANGTNTTMLWNSTGVGIGTTSPILCNNVIGSEYILNSLVIGGAMLYPPTDMSAGTTTMTSSYGSGIYIATASTSFSGSESAYAAFDISINNIWTTSPLNGYSSSTGVYNGSTTTTIDSVGYLGDWIQLQLQYTIQLTRYSIFPRNGNTNRAPYIFYIAGSNNGTTWTMIDQQTDISGYTNSGKFFTVNSNILHNGFTYYRMVVNQNNIGSNGLTSVGYWGLYGSEINAGTNSALSYDSRVLISPNLSSFSGTLFSTNITSTNIVGTTSTIPNSIFTNITTSTLLATTSISSGALFSTNITSTNIVGTTSTIPNSIFTNVTSSTLLATTSISSGVLYSTNITSTNIVGTTATIPNIIHTNITTGALQTSYATQQRTIKVGTSSGTQGNISITGTGQARYHLYNDGGIAEWLIGQKSSTNHSVTFSKLVGNTETDYFVIQSDGAVLASGSLGINTLGNTTQILRVSGLGAATSALFTRNTDGAHYIEMCTPAGGGEFATNSLAGDIIVRTNTGANLLLSTNGSGTASFILSSAGNISLSGSAKISKTTATSMGTLIVAGPGATTYLPATTTSGQLASFYGPGGTNVISNIDLSTFIPASGSNNLPTVRFSMIDLGTFNSTFNILTKNAGASGTMASRIMIDGSGNVGINTTNQAFTLDVSGTTRITNGSLILPFSAPLGGIIATTSTNVGDNFVYQSLTTVGNYGLKWASDNDFGGGAMGYLSAYGGLKFFTFSTVRMTIQTGGNVGINTTAPGDYLQVASVMLMASTGNLTVTGDVLAFGTISDKRLKENVNNINNGLETINNLRPVTFNWKQDIFNEKRRGTSDSGFIAQEVENIIPHAVGEYNLIETDEIYKNMRHERIIPYLVSAIQDLKKQVEELQEFKNSFA
jgi:hypothetical protein